jgi:bifunctional UDP-N-acetylglucosamine pyrophosphorylase/glucosamine-1-phosphate N-acetyltransferase
MQSRIQNQLMTAGVTIVDPRNTYIDGRAQIGRDTIIWPFTVISGTARIGQRCRIGPFTHIRDGTTLADDVELGAFVEVSRSHLEPYARARHLAYIGDAHVGPAANFGAGAVIANFDGVAKSRTLIEAEAFIGAGSVLIAPTQIGSGATVGAGAVVTRNQFVPPGTTVVGVPARPLKPTSSASP